MSKVFKFDFLFYYKMDPFTEKDLIENMRSIATSLRNIDRKFDDVALSLRELSASRDVGVVQDIVETRDDLAKEESGMDTTSGL